MLYDLFFTFMQMDRHREARKIIEVGPPHHLPLCLHAAHSYFKDT